MGRLRLFKRTRRGGELAQLAQVAHFPADFPAPTPGDPRLFPTRYFLRGPILLARSSLSPSRPIAEYLSKSRHISPYLTSPALHVFLCAVQSAPKRIRSRSNRAIGCGAGAACVTPTRDPIITNNVLCRLG